MTHKTENNGVSISLSIPANDSDLFRHKATNDVLAFLVTHRLRRFTLTELATHTGNSPQSVRRAVDVLGTNALVIESPNANSRLVHINRDRLSIPDDPILQIPQAKFQLPVNAAIEELRDRVDNLVGIILYGSVARGEADRRSDIDLWVLTRSGRAVNQREANTVARELEERVFDGDRYAYDIDVESVNSIPDYTAAIREIVVSGISLYTTDDFETVETYLLEISGDNA
ncbi:nucleotidyltransferase domain-containing protein [Halobellus rufus]|uniref:nucleotidyltransferase domain-containing protein n=1 Tax=Halobellus rufus TaxID=1448860 RepID=UPI0009DE485E|nr:nucleotidyltransferase domain-containing protein [Halobellus rufus]